MIKVLLVPSSDYLAHPFPQRHNQIFERLNEIEDFEVHVIRFNLFGKARLKTNLHVHDIRGLPSPSAAIYYLLNAASHASKIRRIIRQEGIDVVVLSNLSAPMAYTFMDELSCIGIPIIVDLPDYYPTSAAGYLFNVKSISGKLLSASFDLILRRIMKHADLVTVVSNGLATYAHKSGARNVKRIHNGISEHFLKIYKGNDARKKLGFEPSDFVVGYIGSVEFWLEMKPLFRGIAELVNKGVPAKLLLVGKGLHTNFIKKVQKEIVSEGIAPHVTWLDFVPYSEVPFYISAIDVGTIPFDISNLTASYSAPNKMWEYLSQLKPVVSTSIPESLCNRTFLSIVESSKDYNMIFSKIINHDQSLLNQTKAGYSESLLNTWDHSTQLFAEAVRNVLNCKR